MSARKIKPRTKSHDLKQNSGIRIGAVIGGTPEARAEVSGLVNKAMHNLNHVRTYPKRAAVSEVTAGPLTDDSIDDGDDGQAGEGDEISTIET